MAINQSPRAYLIWRAGHLPRKDAEPRRWTQTGKAAELLILEVHATTDDQKYVFSSYDASDYEKSIKIYGYTVFDTLLIVLLLVKYLISLLQATTVMHQQVLRSHRNSFSIFLNTTYWISRKIYEIENFICRILCPDFMFLYVKCCINFIFTFNNRSINQ